MNFVKIKCDDLKTIEELSVFAGAIVKEAFDPLIGEEQNDYMINMFQSKDSIRDQIMHGYLYYIVYENNKRIGFLAFYDKADGLYLSKFYLKKEYRGKGYSRRMFEFVCENARAHGFNEITLNVNRNNPAKLIYEKFGMKVIIEEKNDIGNGFFMGDYVYGIQI
ncbi:MAG: GNAT family N-acetyltransferase [Eubacterium sp.]|nr:GNAT family N-acetyltransferase [Eubacterium sp.]